MTESATRRVRPAAICRSWLILAIVTLGTAILPAVAQDEFNILANDEDHGFKPTIVFSESSADGIRGIRDGRDVSYEVFAKPAQLSAVITGNLVQFPFSDIAEDMGVAISIGGFSFEAALGDDVTRRVTRDGEPVAFDPRKTSAVFYLTTELPPRTDDGEPRIKRVGLVKFSWTTKTVTAQVLVTDVEAAGLSGIYDRGELIDAAGFDPDRGGAMLFKNQPVDASLTFGSAVGTRTVFGGGKIRTRYTKVGSERAGNADTLQTDSLTAVGGADIVKPAVVANVPTTDADSNQSISFNGTLTDLAPSTLSGDLFPVSLSLFLDGVELVSDADVSTGDPDYFLAITDPDSKGKSIFTIANLLIPANNGTKHKLVIKAVDGSGNVRKVEAAVGEGGLGR